MRTVRGYDDPELGEPSHGHPHHPEVLAPERIPFAENDRLAASNRAWLEEHGIALFNLIGSPGAGKTALLEGTIARLGDGQRLFVLEGDSATDLDARRIQQAGCGVVQLNTGVGCHLDAAMVANGLRDLAPPRGSVVFVENVGSLVCPAQVDLGERAKVVVMSVTEGEDKALKYPHVFRAAALVVLTKIDLLPHVKFDVPRALAHARSINPRIETITVAAQRGAGLQAWCQWVAAAAGEPLPLREQAGTL